MQQGDGWSRGNRRAAVHRGCQRDVCAVRVRNKLANGDQIMNELDVFLWRFVQCVSRWEVKVPMGHSIA